MAGQQSEKNSGGLKGSEGETHKKWRGAILDISPASWSLKPAFVKTITL